MNNRLGFSTLRAHCEQELETQPIWLLLDHIPQCYDLEGQEGTSFQS